jgi:Uncharacterized protein conserved in bacteria (DUF2066)
MTLRVIATRAVSALALLLVFSFGASAQTSDLWTVTNIPVDGTGASPSAAKDAALAQGRQKAWAEVFRRITPSTEWARQPVLTNAELEPMIKSFDISGEKHSSTRYLATVTFVFNPQGVRSAMRRTGTQFSESTAKPVLVVALNGAAWAPDSAWGRAWSTQSRRGRLVPVAVPVGDVQEMSTLATISSAADWAIVRPLAERYGASSVMVASAAKGGNGLQVNLTLIKPEGRTQRNASYAAQGAEDEVALATRASGVIADSLQEDWKRTTSVDYGQQSSLSLNVPFTNLSEWVSVKRHLDAIKLVQRSYVEELNMSEARLRVDYVGKVEQLQTALSQSNLYLAADANGNWTLSRNATAAAGPITDPVVP